MASLAGEEPGRELVFGDGLPIGSKRPGLRPPHPPIQSAGGGRKNKSQESKSTYNPLGIETGW